jgi:hypothetical protein
MLAMTAEVLASGAGGGAGGGGGGGGGADGGGGVSGMVLAGTLGGGGVVALVLGGGSGGATFAESLPPQPARTKAHNKAGGQNILLACIEELFCSLIVGVLI